MLWNSANFKPIKNDFLLALGAKPFQFKPPMGEQKSSRWMPTLVRCKTNLFNAFLRMAQVLACAIGLVPDAHFFLPPEECIMAVKREGTNQ